MSPPGPACPRCPDIPACPAVPACPGVPPPVASCPAGPFPAWVRGCWRWGRRSEPRWLTW
eukprot:5040633-Lingulodinium_polyedra.AAC.1